MSSHLPECDCYGRNHGECALCNGECVLCICNRLRSCEQRVREENDDYAYVAAQAEADGRRRGWNEALETARERIMRLPYEIDDEILIDRDEVIGWIDGLRQEP
jgi:hypothetical protein